MEIIHGSEHSGCEVSLALVHFISALHAHTKLTYYSSTFPSHALLSHFLFSKQLFETLSPDDGNEYDSKP